MNNPMNNQTKPSFHGSDIEEICRVYHLKKEDIVNFAANVNPLGLSESVKERIAARLDVISSYPDREYASLRLTLSRYCKVPSDRILPAGGSSELISLFIDMLRPKRTLLIGPIYSEYSRELSGCGSEQSYFILKEEDEFRPDMDALEKQLAGKYDLLILCNPNNPTSSAFSVPLLERLLTVCEKNGTFVMIDETYVEFAPSPEQITALPLTARFQNLIVLRGVSKFFAAPGLRLGYAVSGNISLLGKMREKQIPWSLNSVAALAGEYMFSDTDYINRIRNLILSERERISQALARLPGCQVYPAFANFFLVRLTGRGGSGRACLSSGYGSSERGSLTSEYGGSDRANIISEYGGSDRANIISEYGGSDRASLTASGLFDVCIRHGLMIRDCSSFAHLPGEYVRFCIMKPEDNDRLLHVFSEALD